ncbi:hypothetical protein L1887_48566 [Cichorium endivia]|nr:hypothetical protein L1887_48566 [Cichorium endivia]
MAADLDVQYSPQCSPFNANALCELPRFAPVRERVSAATEAPLAVEPACSTADGIVWLDTGAHHTMAACFHQARRMCMPASTVSFPAATANATMLLTIYIWPDKCLQHLGVHNTCRSDAPRRNPLGALATSTTHTSSCSSGSAEVRKPRCVGPAEQPPLPLQATPLGYTAAASLVRPPPNCRTDRPTPAVPSSIDFLTPRFPIC